MSEKASVFPLVCGQGARTPCVAKSGDYESNRLFNYFVMIRSYP